MSPPLSLFSEYSGPFFDFTVKSPGVAVCNTYAAVLADQAVAAVQEILSDPEPQLLVEAYGDSAIEYTLRCWVRSTDYVDARYALNEAVYGAFAKNGVEMTYPHINVHMN